MTFALDAQLLNFRERKPAFSCTVRMLKASLNETGVTDKMLVPTNFFDSFKFWLHWKEESVKSLKRGWTIDDAIALVAFFEYTIATGLSTPREADKQLRKVLKPTRLTIVSMSKYCQAQVVLAEGREMTLRAFLMFDSLVSFLERHYHPDSEAVFESFKPLIPHLEEYSEAVCSWCEYAGRPYLLPEEFWRSYDSPIMGFSLYRPLAQWFINRPPNLHPKTIGVSDLFRADAQTALTRRRHRPLGRVRKGDRTDERPLKLSCAEDELLDVLSLIESQLIESCSRLTILDSFSILEGLLLIAEERWLVSEEDSKARFKRLRSHLLEGLTFVELKTHIELFGRPYNLLDG